jgi:hypothetical protein
MYIKGEAIVVMPNMSLAMPKVDTMLFPNGDNLETTTTSHMLGKGMVANKIRIS